MRVAVDNILNNNDNNNECHDENVNDDDELCNTTKDMISGSHLSSNINTEDRQGIDDINYDEDTPYS